MASSRNRYDKEERYIVSSLEPSDNTNRIWKCKLCSENFDSVIKGAFHVWLYCSKSKIVSRWALVPTESIVKICAFLDPVSCGSMPEMYRRVQAEDDGNDNDDDESHTTEEGKGIVAEPDSRKRPRDNLWQTLMRSKRFRI